MQVLSIKKDGTTTVELTDAEAHQIRDALGKAAEPSETASWTLHRLLSHGHGDTEQQGA